MGLYSAASGFGSGLSGVLTQPMDGYSREGAYGLLTGSIKGLAGVVVKPVSGTLDLISNTTEGFKNT